MRPHTRVTEALYAAVCYPPEGAVSSVLSTVRRSLSIAGGVRLVQPLSAHRSGEIP